MENKDIRCEFCNWLNKETLLPFICTSCKKINNQPNIVIDIETNDIADWALNLRSIKGIGDENIKDIKKIYNTEEELRVALINHSVPLRNDIVKKLEIYFNIDKMKGGVE